MVFGIFLGLLSAFIWATTSLAIKAMADRIDTSSFNAFRMIVASVFTFALLPFFGDWAELMQVPLGAILTLSASSIIGIALGDTLYFWGMTKIGAARALPISGTYPLFTWVLAVPLLGEPITPAAIAGTALVLFGVSLLAPQMRDATPANTRAERIGMLAVVAAAALWAISTTLFKVGMGTGQSALVTNAIRLPVAALSSVIVTHWQSGARAWRGYDRASLPKLILLAVYCTGFGMIVWTTTVDIVGAARAALLNTAAPLIGVPLSVLWLKERVTSRIVIGATFSVIGVWLIL